MLVLLVATLCGCGGRATPIGPEADGGADRPDADAGEPDGAPYCECTSDPPRPTFMFHRCVPPTLFGCEARSCTPGGDDCPAGSRCDEWGAAACCYCSAVVPACVPSSLAMGPLPDYLAIAPVHGPAGRELDLEVTGFPFYVGALFHLARVGESAELPEVGGGECSLAFRAPGLPAGTAPVWLSQYGGHEPWVLAGFLAYGAETATCIQPGYPCGDAASLPCCATAEVPVSCRAGRCLRE